MSAITKQFYLLATICLLTATASNAQLKIGTNSTAINAASLLEMESTNKGLVLPRVSLTALATAAPLEASLLEGTIVYNTNAALAGGVGIYLWRTGGLGWLRLPFAANAGVTLNDAYNFGGAGSGRTITANTGAVKIDGNDGLLVTGTYNSGVSIDASGAGTRMFFNPKKAAFRAGWVDGTQWDDANVGGYSIALGPNTIASDIASMALGIGARATSNFTFAAGSNATASGMSSTAVGRGATAAGDYATAVGYNVTAKSYGGMAVGSANDDSDNPSFAAASATDRIFQVGNGGSGGPPARSNALTILRNGNAGIGVLAPQQKLEINGQIKIIGGSPGTGKVLTSDVDGVASWVTPTAGITGITLDQAYDFGGAGAGRTITADAGAVKIAGNDGLLVTGNEGVGANIEPSGAGTRLFFNPRKAAFRAGNVYGDQWDNANVGRYSAAMGSNVRASGSYSFAAGWESTASGEASVAMGYMNTASGLYTTAFGLNASALGNYSFAAGLAASASNEYSIAMGNSQNASGYSSAAIGGSSNNATGDNAATLGGFSNYATGILSVAMGNNSIASGDGSLAVGYEARAKSFGGIALGSYNDYGDAPNGSAAASTDRIFQIGNGADASNRTNAITVLRNGRTGLSTLAPTATLHVGGTDGLLVTGTYGSGASIEASGEGTRMFFNPKKAAIRAGYVNSNQWDDANVGDYSVAMGYGSTASGETSLAMGRVSTATGYSSTALGYYASATGHYSFSAGDYNNSSGFAAVSMGSENEASGSTAVAIGYNNDATSRGAVAIGFWSKAYGQYAVALGHNTYARSFDGIAMGGYNDNTDNPNGNAPMSTDRIFQLGNGNADHLRSNAITVLRNGNTGVGVLNPATHKLEVDGRIRQKIESQVVTVPANGATNFTWTHNLGYRPIIMISLDHTGGAGYMDYCSFSYGHDNDNTVHIYLTNRGGNTASGTVRWIVVY